MFFFYMEMDKIMSNGHPRHVGFPKAEDLDKVNLDRAYQIYKERYANAKDFVFTIVGNFEEATLRTLVEKYIASLPADMNAAPEKFKDLGIRPPKEANGVKKEIKSGQDPKSQVSLVYTGDLKKEKDAFAIRAFGDILENKLIENLREDKGGVYSPQAGASTSKIPYSKYSINVGFSCAPENVEKLVNAVFEEVGKLQKEGPQASDMQKIKETYRREFEKNSKENGFWATRIQNLYSEGAEAKTLAESQARIEALTAKEIQAVAKKYAVKSNLINVALYPEKVVTESKPTDKPKEEAGAEGKNTTEPAKDMTAEKVIENYIKAIGGKEKLEKVVSLRQTSNMEIMGMQMEMTMSKKGTDKMLMVQVLPMGQGEVRIVVNGDKGSMKSPMGDQALEGDMLKAYKGTGMFPELQYLKDASKMALLPSEVINEKTTYPIKFTGDAGVSITNWYDAKTGLVVKSNTPQGEVTIENYQEVNGIKFPEKTIIKSPQGEVKSTMKTEVNPTLSDDLFKVE
jgi:hypothetical protein